MTSVEKLMAKMAVEENTQSKIRDSYLRRTRASAAAFADARQWLAGGVSRQAGYWAPYPISLDRGSGPRVWDIDGNEYIDLINNYSSMIHGHAHPDIEAAVRSVIPKGTAWVGNCASQTELARLLVKRVASVDRVRFTNSGSEAANLALMVARAVTGRHQFLMVRNGYHGSLMEFGAGSFGLEGPGPYVARYNDLAEFEAVLDAHGPEIAAVFIEPVWTFGGVIEGTRPFIEGVRQRAHSAGALLVLDEVVTFRLGVGGAQGKIGVDADLTMFGKLIGGGFPIGAVGGKAEHMSSLDASGGMKAIHSGTFNGNPVSTAAGIASLNALTAEEIARLDRISGLLGDGLTAKARKIGLPIRINRSGSILGLFFQDEQPENPLLRDDRQLMTNFHLAALNHGVLIAPRGMMALSTAMTDSTIGEIVERAGRAMEDASAER